MSATEIFSPLRWRGGVLELIDQLRLPGEEVWIACASDDDVHRAIRDMVVRGAPAIGCAAAYGVALAARRLASKTPAAGHAEIASQLGKAIDHLATARPTAVNLFWALGEMREAMERHLASGSIPIENLARLLEERACAIHAEDIAMCQRMGKLGAALLPDRCTVLTHCNAGALATGGYGTALGVIRAAHEAGKTVRVIADETRPYLQGVRLTAWELEREGFDVTVIPDSAAAALLRRGEIDCCVVGADRIARNGDVANKIGTYSVALAARAHGVPFYVAAPRSTIDLATASGDGIPIEERGGDELLEVAGKRMAPASVTGRYPAFDVTPAELVTAIITDAGVARAPLAESLRRLMSSQDPVSVT